MRKFLIFLLLPFLYAPKALSFYQHSTVSSIFSGISPCAAIACGNLNHFIACLRSEVSLYRYYGFRPQLANTPKAKEAYRRFAQTHPRCFETFCQNVCTLPPKNYRPHKAIPEKYQTPTSFASQSPGTPIQSYRRSSRSKRSSSGSFDSFDSSGSSFEDSEFGSYGGEDADTDEEEQQSTRFSRARKAFFGGVKKGYRGFRRGINSTHRWATHKYNKRQTRLRKERVQKARQAAQICTMNAPEGTQLRALCGACLSHLPPSFRLVPACHVNAAGVPYQSRQGGKRYQSTSQSHMQRTDFERPDASFDSTYASPRSRHASPSQGRLGARRVSAGSIHYSQFEGASVPHESFQAAFGPREGRSVSGGSQPVSASQPSSSAPRRTASPSAASEPGLSPDGSASADGFDDVEPFWDH